MPMPFARLLVVAASSCLGAAAFAQQVPAAPPVPQAGQVTPRDLRPEVAPKPAAAVPAAAPERAPAHADTLFVSVDAIAVDDGFPEFVAVTAALLPPYTKHRVAASEFYKLAAAIEAIYHDAGYPLVRVLVPPQALADGGTLHLKVLDGFIERVDVQAVAPAGRADVALMTQSLVGRHRLTNAALERALTLAGRVPGVTLRSALGAGTQPGGTVLVLEGESVAYGASVEGDNHLPGSLGPWETTVQLRLNQPSRRGEQFYGYVSSGPDWSKTLIQDVAVRRVIGGGVLIPLGLDGLQLDPEYTWSDTKPRAGPGALKSESKFERFTLRLSYPLILDHEQELTLTGALEATDQSNAAPDFGVTFTDDRLRVGRLTLDWTGSVPTGHLHAYAIGSQGTRGLGARTASDVAQSFTGFSRVGEDPAFTKLEVGLALSQPLPASLQSTLTLRAQAAKGVLPGSELFGLDGDDALSIFTSGAISDDGGWTAREEIARPASVTVDGTAVSLAPYGFGAVGRNTTKILPASVQGLSAAYGVGLRSSWDTISLEAEYGHRQSHPDELNGNQFFLKAQVQF
jgi:hemolysin activation/secretion protein